MNRTVTIAAMLLTGEPQGTIYGIYQGRLSFRKGQPYSFNLNKAIRVGTAIVPKDQKANYFEMSRRFETADFPAFTW